MGALRCGSRLKPPAPAWQGRPSPTRPIRKGCSEEANNRRHGGGNRPSGNDVGRQLVLEPRELVAQQQLAFLEPLDLELVGLARRPQRLDRRVEITVLLSQPLNLSGERGAFLRRQPLFIVVHPCPFYARPAAPSTPPLRRGARTQSPYAGDAGRGRIFPQNVGDVNGYFTGQRYLGACAEHSLCHNFTGQDHEGAVPCRLIRISANWCAATRPLRKRS